MTTVERPNNDALTQAVNIYRDAMRPFIVRCLRQVRGSKADDLIRGALRDRQAEDFDSRLKWHSGNVEASIDVDDFPTIIQKLWRLAFERQLAEDRTILNRFWLVKAARDQVSHPGATDLQTADTVNHLYQISTVLRQISAPQEADAVQSISDKVQRPEQTGGVTSPPDLPMADLGKPEPPRTNGSLAPWRNVIRPNVDVAHGTSQEAEFAADLQQVKDGRASATSYGDPVKFFGQTYVTSGLKTLLVNVLSRIGGTGGDPVIQTKTGFGGGKTHSLIALYHLVESVSALVNAPEQGGDSRASSEIRKIIGEAGLDPDAVPEARIAVIVGTFHAPTDVDTTAGGDPLNTLWGLMAHQLGGQDGYDIIGEAARQDTAPSGRQLDALFERVGPCVILIDELVAYVRNVPGAAVDSIYTFVQTLTESVRRSKNAALVVTLPQSDIEAGGEAGVQALARLDHILGRIESVWQPLEVNETFEIVRRRLFESAIDESERDRTCEAFARMYSSYRREYPQGAGESQYLQRMKACYPIHPEIFDRLYSDWSSIPQFQRTRGVLRMMANCVSRLYLSNDPSPLIMPATLPLDDPAFANEFIRLLPGQWDAVISEVDSDSSRTDEIDRSNPRTFGDVGGAARRIARTRFLGSAPAGAVRGIDGRQIHLGVVQPGHGVSAYNDALGRMSGELYYLYSAGDRHFFNAEPNLNRLAADRAVALSDADVTHHVVERLEEARGRRQDVISCPGDSADVPDTDSVRLIIIPPDRTLPTRSSESDLATDTALRLLTERGDAGRTHRNMLLFLAAKSDEVRNLKSAVRRRLAWHSILNGADRVESLSGERVRQANDSLRAADSDVRNGLVSAYRWALWPVQDDPQNDEYSFRQEVTDAADTGDIVWGAFEKFAENEALVNRITPAALATMLSRYVWTNQAYRDHVKVETLWRMLTSNVYMHRLKNRSVLETCIDQGVTDGAFGIAGGYSESEGKYADLRFKESLDPGLLGISGLSGRLLITPDMAELVRQESRPETTTTQDWETDTGNGPDDQHGQTLPDDTEDPPTPTQPAGPRRILATKTFQGDLSLDAVGQLRDEIIRNLNHDGGSVTVQITISAEKSDGFSAGITRSVRENGQQLGLDLSFD